MSYQKPELLDPAPTGDTVKESILKTDVNVDDIYWSLNDILSKIPGAQNPQQLLDAIKTVDGSGSGLDADYLDGIDSTGFELALGNPAVDGYILSSSITGVRSWIPAPIGGGPGEITWEQIIAIMAPHDGDGSTIDADMVDGIHASGFAQAGHSHNDATPAVSGFMSTADKTKLDDMADPALLEEFRSFSTGTPDAGMPIKLDGYGVLDVSFISIKVFNLEGDWTPTAGNEYPAPADPGDYWIVENVGDIVSGGYTFTSGFLSGKTIYDNELLVKGRDDKWGIIHMKVDPNLYYRLDGTNHLTADFQAGGHKLSNIAAGTVATDAVNKAQLDAELGSFLPLTGGTLTGILESTKKGAAINLLNTEVNYLSGVAADGSNGWFFGRGRSNSDDLMLYNYKGDSLEFPVGGGALINNDQIWHAGNFDPDSKLNITGGALSGRLIISEQNEAITLSNTNANWLGGKASDGSNGWYIGRGIQNANHVFVANYHGSLLVLSEGGGVTIDDNTVWHAGNFTPDSKEDDLGNPSVTGHVLSSDTAGNRSWIEMEGGSAPVDSVNGKTGVVVLNASDVGAAPTSHDHSEYLEKAGDTMTGFLNTKGQADGKSTISGGGGSRTIDLSLGNFFNHDNGGSAASYTMSAPSGNAGGLCFVIYLSGSGSKTFNNTVWVNGNSPDNSNGVAVIFSDSGGAGTWIGAWGPV